MTDLTKNNISIKTNLLTKAKKWKKDLELGLKRSVLIEIYFVPAFLGVTLSCQERVLNVRQTNPKTTSISDPYGGDAVVVKISA